MADNTEKLLKDIIRSLSSIESVADQEVDLSKVERRLETITDQLGDLIHHAEHQTQALLDLSKALAPDEDETPNDDDDSAPEIH